MLEIIENRIILEDQFLGLRDKITFAVEKLMNMEFPEIVIDMEKVSFIDSTAMGSLVKCHQLCKGCNISFLIINYNKDIKRSFMYAGLSEIFQIG